MEPMWCHTQQKRPGKRNKREIMVASVVSEVSSKPLVAMQVKMLRRQSERSGQKSKVEK